MELLIYQFMLGMSLFERIDSLAKEKDIAIRFPIMGGSIPILENITTTNGWELKKLIGLNQ